MVTTPFTLARLLSSRCFLFLRLSHLLLDEADRLFTLAPEQVKHLLPPTASRTPLLALDEENVTVHFATKGYFNPAAPHKVAVIG